MSRSDSVPAPMVLPRTPGSVVEATHRDQRGLWMLTPLRDWVMSDINNTAVLAATEGLTVHRVLFDAATPAASVPAAVLDELQETGMTEYCDERVTLKGTVGWSCSNQEPCPVHHPTEALDTAAKAVAFGRGVPEAEEWWESLPVYEKVRYRKIAYDALISVGFFDTPDASGGDDNG